MIVVSVIGIILAFAVLIFAAYKKISMFLAAVLAAAIVALFGGLDVAASLVGLSLLTIFPLRYIFVLPQYPR